MPAAPTLSSGAHTTRPTEHYTEATPRARLTQRLPSPSPPNQQALTTTCECGALRDVSALNAGRQCGSCGPRYRPTESHRIQLKMADALISGERILILLPTKGSHSYCIRGRTASLRAAHIARERAARLFHSRRKQSRSSSYNNSSLCGADP